MHRPVRCATALPYTNTKNRNRNQEPLRSDTRRSYRFGRWSDRASRAHAAGEVSQERAMIQSKPLRLQWSLSRPEAMLVERGREEVHDAKPGLLDDQRRVGRDEVEEEHATVAADDVARRLACAGAS